jgi:hypothetical protein
VDVSRATVIALYMSEAGNEHLLRAVSRTLQPGTRVVSLAFGVQGWRQHLVRIDTAMRHPIHLYRYQA